MHEASRKIIEVWGDWFGDRIPQKVGILNSFITRGKETFSFEYDDSWLRNALRFQLDPGLKLFKGAQFSPQDAPNFGVFLDSSPDRWGRTLLQRREVWLARGEKRPPRTLMESDYLLGVHDAHRMGALRFRYPNGPFLDDSTEYASPPWISLRELERASLHLEDEHADNDSRLATWLKLLVAPGSSLGGARPKAGVVDAKQRLWIAKFPSRNDTRDVGAWEAVAHTLARQCGINVPEFRLERFGGKGRTFLSRRFDRAEKQQRIHFASVMTLLQRKDGDHAEQGASYLEIADFIIGNGERVEHDLKELWRRIVFFIGIANADDHLRNHGFLLRSGGWEISPAYDMNPDPSATGLSLNISESDNTMDFDLAKSIAPFFRLTTNEAGDIVDGIKKTVSGWRRIAKRHGIVKREQDIMEKCFRC